MLEMDVSGGNEFKGGREYSKSSASTREDRFIPNRKNTDADQFNLYSI